MNAATTLAVVGAIGSVATAVVAVLQARRREKEWTGRPDGDRVASPTTVSADAQQWDDFLLLCSIEARRRAAEGEGAVDLDDLLAAYPGESDT